MSLQSNPLLDGIHNSVEADIEREMSSFPPNTALTNLAKKYWDKPSVLARAAVSSPYFRIRREDVQTIAIFFHAFGTGGGERVTRDLACLWDKMGYRVIVLTNVEPMPNDYVLPETIKRITVPTYVGITADTFDRRCSAFQTILKKHQVDILVFSHWFSDCLAFDLLNARSLGIPTLLYIQSSFSFFFLEADLPQHYADIPLQYVAANGIVCLSETDRYFWSRFNSNVFVTYNPLTIAPSSSSARLEGHTILWPARLNRDKRPDRVIPIMRELIKKVPDARVLMVGPGDPLIIDEINQQIDETLIGHVILCGEQHEDQMQQFYLHADAFLLTSEREGWSLALGEALSSGLPCVIYDLPYLTLTQNNSAVISVPQGDAVAAAGALEKILTNKSYAHKLGQAGREFMRHISQYDYIHFWRECFRSLTSSETNDASPHLPEEERFMWNELLKAYQAHLRSFGREQMDLRDQIIERDGIINNISMELEKVTSSHSFKIGLVMTAPLRAIKKLLSSN